MKNLNLQRKYRLLMENSQEIILFFNQFGFIVGYNKKASEELGYDDSFGQANIKDIFRKAFKDDHGHVVVASRFCDCQSETIAYRMNQTCITVNLKVTIEQGKDYLGICTAVNISDKKDRIRELHLLKNEIKSANRMKNDFIANITHELRTPINGIMGLTDNLLDTELTPKQLDTINVIHNCCLNMNRIINDLLDFTKMVNNRLVLEQRCFNFRSFIDNIIAVNIRKINEKGLKLLVNVAEDIPSQIMGDELRLAQIVNNLLSNAIKFTSVGQIAIEIVKTLQTDTAVELFFVIMDTGIGISAEDKDRIFQSFTQEDSSITRRFGGTGLGLAICKKLVEAMHGTITVESEKNVGSTFSFSVCLSVASGMENDVEKEYSQLDNPAGRIQLRDETNYFLGVDYIGKMLDDAVANISESEDGNYRINPVMQQDMKQNMNDILELIEKLIICIEMENWVKAENFAEQIKIIISKDQVNLSNTVLRLLFSIRKEEYSKSLTILNTLKEMVNEVRPWKV